MAHIASSTRGACAMPVVLLLTSWLALVVHSRPPLEPITKNLDFRAYYRAQTFVRALPISSSDVYESYHSALATGIIRHTVQFEATQLSTGVTKYLYDSRGRKVVEFAGLKLAVDDGDELFHDDFCLFENGCTNSYASTGAGDDDNGARHSERYESIRLLPAGMNLDAKLLMAGADDSLPRLNLDLFMSDECLDFFASKLHYINGVSRLLHLIECRREEFKLKPVDESLRGLGTRGIPSRQYRASKLTPLSAPLVRGGAGPPIESLDVLVTVFDETMRQNRTARPAPTVLEPGFVPLSIVIEFEPSVSILVDVFQFESVGPDEHLSEPANGAHSIFMMPLGHPDLGRLLYSVSQQSYNAGDDDDDGYDNGSARTGSRSFSFHATLTGSLLSKTFTDPIDLAVSYDAELRTLSSEMSFVDRSSLDGLNSYNRWTVRQLLDGQSSLRFHSMDSNFGYRRPVSLSTSVNQDDDAERGWRSCATSHLAPNESELLLASGGELFTLNGATYMGMALVRGIPCRVYERPLYKLPTLLGLGSEDYAHTTVPQSDIYLASYVYTGQNQLTGRRETKFVRSHIRLVGRTKEAPVRMSLVLELNSFTWAPSDLFLGGAGGGAGSLASAESTLVGRMTQDCLLVTPGVRHLDMQLWFGRQRANGVVEDVAHGRANMDESQRQQRLIQELQTNRQLRDRAVTRMLTRALQISPVQQVDLASEILAPHDGGRSLSSPASSTSTSTAEPAVGGRLAASERGRKSSDDDRLLYVKFSLYELWNDFVDVEFLGYALDLSMNTRFPANSAHYAIGARSYSYDDCKWRTVHSLQPAADGLKSEYGRRDDDADGSMMNSVRLFMYCPKRLICILGDPSWLPMRHKRPVKLDELLEFPYSSSATARAAAVAAAAGAKAKAAAATPTKTKQQLADPAVSSSSDGHDRPPTRREDMNDDAAADHERHDDKDDNKCLVSSVIVRQQSSLSNARTGAVSGRRSKLDWWLLNGRHGSKAAAGADDDDEHLAQLRIGELNFELKVEMARPAAAATAALADGGGGGYHGSGLAPLPADGKVQAAGTGGPATRTTRPDTSASLLMRVHKMRLSNKMLISNANLVGPASIGFAGDGDEEEDNEFSLLVKPVRGVAYVPPSGQDQCCDNNNNDNNNNGFRNSLHGGGGAIKPLIVSNLAECSRACLLLHGCRSFSACHQLIDTRASSGARLAGGKISCVFSKLKWSNRSEVNQLVRLSRAGGFAGRSQRRGQQQGEQGRGQPAAGERQQVSMEVNFNEQQSPAGGAGAIARRQKVSLKFELSPLCSLYARPQLDLFHLRRSSVEIRPQAKYLIYAKSAEQCARFCQERAQLMRQLAPPAPADHQSGMTGAFRWAACYEFYYSPDNQYCQLTPKLEHWAALKLEHLLGPAGADGTGAGQHATVDPTSASASAIVRRWMDWFRARTPHQSWLERLRSVFGETEYYELDFRQIFSAHRNRRLTLTAGGDQAGQRRRPPRNHYQQSGTDETLQTRLWLDSAASCADQCLKRKGCRSFSVQTWWWASEGGGSANGTAQRNTLCLLSAVSARELAADPQRWPSFGLEQTPAGAAERPAAASDSPSAASSSGATWWHYEPSDLALFMIADPDEPADAAAWAGRRERSGGRLAAAADDDSASDVGVFVQAPAAGEM
jgi:hypothetical protein